jgi:predicted DNA-binding ribbon-helix-helix protein
MPQITHSQPGGRCSSPRVATRAGIAISGCKTSVSLEDEFWKALKLIVGERDMKLWELVTSIDSDRQHGNLSSAIRLFVLNYYRSALNEEGRAWRAAPNGNHGTLARGEA